ncbi:hypothetical protein QBC35DRAFT_454584 [Podospora australis]|uniref:Uncharacterized protein n=1 Tax=Podospora australis TaxID=1536484 RepID=A0AAN6WN37_9PEZI|nr:hypothetical protein QBC35DRAFT_454584 [Podospora australis]
MYRHYIDELPFLACAGHGADIVSDLSPALRSERSLVPSDRTKTPSARPAKPCQAKHFDGGPCPLLTEEHIDCRWCPAHAEAKHHLQNKINTWKKRVDDFGTRTLFEKNDDVWGLVEETGFANTVIAWRLTIMFTFYTDGDPGHIQAVASVAAGRSNFVGRLRELGDSGEGLVDIQDEMEALIYDDYHLDQIGGERIPPLTESGTPYPTLAELLTREALRVGEVDLTDVVMTKPRPPKPEKPEPRKRYIYNPDDHPDYKELAERYGLELSGGWSPEDAPIYQELDRRWREERGLPPLKEEEITEDPEKEFDFSWDERATTEVHPSELEPWDGTAGDYVEDFESTSGRDGEGDWSDWNPEPEEGETPDATMRSLDDSEV